MKKVNFIALAMMVLPLFTACTNDEDTEPEVDEELEAVLVEDLYAPDNRVGGTDSVYFSLENNTIVSSKEDDWDIGFYGTKIVVNGGESGGGQVAATLLIETIFDELEMVPDDVVFRTDTKSDPAIPNDMGNGWWSYDYTTHFVTPIAARVILVKTNAGNYAKLEVLSFFKGNPPAEERKLADMYYYTFRYMLQSNGTMTF